MKNLYLDIDGVILIKVDDEVKEADNLLEFLKYATEKFDCYWLTTHCKGDSTTAIEYLKNKVSAEAHGYLTKLKPTNWRTLKTEAIDFNKDFIWIDNYIMDAEKEVLKKNNCLDKYIKIDIVFNPAQLKEIANNKVG